MYCVSNLCLQCILSFSCHIKGQVIALSISLPHAQEVELWEASCYGLGDELDHLINIGTNVNKATVVSTSFC